MCEIYESVALLCVTKYTYSKFVQCCSSSWNRAFMAKLKMILEMPEYVTPTDTKSDVYSSELSRRHMP
jgi:hypothetical protein